MPELMKDKYYNHDSLYELALNIRAVYHSFLVDDFVDDIHGRHLE